VSAARYVTVQTVTLPSSSGSRGLDIFHQNIGNHCPSDTVTHAGRSEFFIITWPYVDGHGNISCVNAVEILKFRILNILYEI
jgi:hypothetical protein